MASKAAPILLALTVLATGLSTEAGAVYVDVEGFASNAEKVRLIESAAERWNSVTQWLIEYEFTLRTPATDNLPEGHKIVAEAATGEFYHFSARFQDYPWQMDPYCQEFLIHQGSSCHRWPFNRIYSEGKMKAGDPLPGTMPKEVLFVITPSWPITDFKMPVDTISGTPVIPTQALKLTDYRLFLKSERIAGEDCAVFDRNHVERMWVAIKKGICVMRRDIRDPRSGRLRERIVTDKVSQIAPGLWLPIDFRNQIFSATDGTNEVIKLETKIRILRCDLNDKVPESVFIPVHRPGSLRYDENNQYTQVTPGGEDLLDDIVNFMTKYAHLPTKPLLRNHPYLWLLGGLGTGLCAGFLLFPTKKSRSMKAKVCDTPVSAPSLNVS